MRIVADKAVLYVEPVRKRDTQEVLWTVLKVTENGNTISINDGGHDLSLCPQNEPCKIDLEVVPSLGKYGLQFRLSKSKAPVIVPLK